MKAAVINRFGGPEVFEISQIDVPEIAEDELLIEVKGGSLNPIDWKQRKGNHRFIFGSKFPIVLGYDVSGVVVKTGTKVQRFNIGDKVCGVLNNKYGGGLAQFTSGTESCFTIIDDAVQIAEAAVLPLSGLTALQVLRDKAGIKAKQKLLLIGAAGGVGHYALQIASIYGADIVAVSSDRHRNFISNLADCQFVDYTKTDIRKLSKRFDIVFDTIGTYPFPDYHHLLYPGGIHVNILPRPKILYHKILALFTKGKKAQTLLMKHSSEDLQLLMEWIVEKKLKLCIHKEFTLEQIGEAHAYMQEGHTEGKILIRYSND